jgi:hypothetical protein
MTVRILPFFFGLVALAGPLQGEAPRKTASYREVAVFPLPDRPPNEIAPLIAVLRETVSTGSQLEEIQRVLWLQQLSTKELTALRENFPNPWTKNAIPGYREIDPFRLKEQIETALITHPENPVLNDELLTAPLRAFQAAGSDWGLALDNQPPEGESDARTRYQYGLMHAIQCADSLTEAIAMHESLFGPRKNLVHSTLADAWPISEVWDFLETLPVDKRSGCLPPARRSEGSGLSQQGRRNTRQVAADAAGQITRAGRGSFDWQVWSRFSRPGPERWCGGPNPLHGQKGSDDLGRAFTIQPARDRPWDGGSAPRARALVARRSACREPVACVCRSGFVPPDAAAFPEPPRIEGSGSRPTVEPQDSGGASRRDGPHRYLPKHCRLTGISESDRALRQPGRPLPQ